ncbi:hypothetical protein M2317_002923 [Microbacterium sp. ZKA21]|uniref:hypothetical protein n=1 Tax=Microbacterium sp. ZKA21 TaxID=3381694 RepID=UPI003D1F06DA
MDAVTPLSPQTGEKGVNTDTPDDLSSNEGIDPAEGTDPDGTDDLATIPQERLAQMLRDKRKAEASVRQKLRDVEASHATLETAVTGFRARQVRAAAEKAGALDTALDDVVSAVPLEDLLAEDGTVDDEKLTTALTTLREQKPFYWPTQMLPRSSGGQNHTGPTYSGGASWGDVING